MRAGIIFIGAVFILATLAVPIIGQHIDWIKPFFQQDLFAMANLEADVTWSNWHLIPGLFLITVLYLFYWYFKSRNYSWSFFSLYFGMAIFVMLTLIFDINNFETYSQRAAIDFYKSKADEDCYIIPYGFKTYGHLFYAQKRQVKNPESYNTQWLLEGKADKPVYIVSKITKAEELAKNPQLVETGRKNGFVFFKRK